MGRVAACGNAPNEMYKTWHYLVRISPWILFPLVLAGIVFHQNPLLAAAQGLAVPAIVALGLTGAVLALLLLFTRFRLRCPACLKRDTQFGASKPDGMWLARCKLHENQRIQRCSAPSAVILRRSFPTPGCWLSGRYWASRPSPPWLQPRSPRRACSRLASCVLQSCVFKAHAETS